MIILDILHKCNIVYISVCISVSWAVFKIQCVRLGRSPVSCSLYGFAMYYYFFYFCSSSFCVCIELKVMNFSVPFNFLLNTHFISAASSQTNAHLIPFLTRVSVLKAAPSTISSAASSQTAVPPTRTSSLLRQRSALQSVQGSGLFYSADADIKCLLGGGTGVVMLQNVTDFISCPSRRNAEGHDVIPHP